MILVTGGAGYIGSHIVKELTGRGYKTAVLDNLSTGHRASVPEELSFFTADLLDKEALDRAFETIRPGTVMHFAAKSIVPESISRPLDTFYQNLTGTMNLLSAMQKHGTGKMVFSSTAAVYGEPADVPINEEHPLKPTNPYGESKLFVEKIMSRLADSGSLQYISLRYFNAAGADPDGHLGEDHRPETHLVPLILAAAAGKKDDLLIYGNDYPTADGTAVRDYIHISDLASAHILALEALLKGSKTRSVYNLGNERGYSVMEVIKKAKKVTGKNINFRFGPRREGDPSTLVAGSGRIKKELKWQARHSDLENIIETAWKWHQENPHGYRD